MKDVPLSVKIGYSYPWEKKLKEGLSHSYSHGFQGYGFQETGGVILIMNMYRKPPHVLGSGPMMSMAIHSKGLSVKGRSAKGAFGGPPLADLTVGMIGRMSSRPGIHWARRIRQAFCSVSLAPYGRPSGAHR